MSITDELREYANTRISPNKGMLLDIADRIDAEYKRMQADNAKLREQVDYMTPLALYAASERERDRMRELGIEVDEC